jgi:hypothetical protein
VSIDEIPIAERVLNGAKLLGQLWRAGERCASGWSLGKEAGCSCGEAGTKFCKARELWVSLAVIDGRDPLEGEFALALMMKASEWDATGLVMTAEPSQIGLVTIGPKPASEVTMLELASLARSPDSAGGILKLMRKFPGSVMDLSPTAGAQEFR